MKIDVFKEEITKKFYKDYNGLVFQTQTNDGDGVSGIVECGIEESINFDDDNMIIALTNDLKYIIPLKGSECEIKSEEDDDTFIIKNKECVYILSFIYKENTDKEVF